MPGRRASFRVAPVLKVVIAGEGEKIRTSPVLLSRKRFQAQTCQ
jgi:hypothetical protein